MAESQPGSRPALLAICSDLDDTPGPEAYFELMRFLNTTEQTTMGRGVGLEVGNSIYFEMAASRFSYWGATEENRRKIRLLIKSGHIDCLHSYGDLATKRHHAERALQELERHGCRLRVWVDHSKAPSNFGSDIMMGHGDELAHPAYHADLTLAYGIQYIWRGRVTSVIGQNRPASLAGIGNWRHPIESLRTVVKEAAKQALGRGGSVKYAAHGDNRVLRPVRLRDGRGEALEFLRCNPHWGGVSCGDTGERIGEVLTEGFLRRLAGRGGVCILYTHLGKLRNGTDCFCPAAIEGFRRLAECQKKGLVRVLTTSRLLDKVAGRKGSSHAETEAALSFPL